MFYTPHRSVLSVLHIVANTDWERFHSIVKWASCYMTFLYAVSNDCRLNCHLESLLYKSLNHSFSILHHFVCFCFETGSHYVAPAGLDINMLQSSVSDNWVLVSQVWMALCSKSRSSWAGVAQWLRTLALLAENLSSVPSTHMVWFTCACNSSYRGTWYHLLVPVHTCIHIIF